MAVINGDGGVMGVMGDEETRFWWTVDSQAEERR